jgi:hypothetical protein
MTVAHSITSSVRGEQRRLHRKAQCLGGLEVDHQLVFRRRLHRQIGRLLALENAIHIAGRAAELVDQVDPVGNEAPGCDVEADGVDRG